MRRKAIVACGGVVGKKHVLNKKRVCKNCGAHIAIAEGGGRD